MMPRSNDSHSVIRIRGARQHNLKNIDLDIPLNRITVITGLSGSGKSSLAFDTLYAEGQRRYVETFSPYARQFMERMDRPQVDRIENIPPAIAIDRKDPVRTSRSTVGTMTELTDYVKLLYARAGQLHCRKCGKPVIPETPERVWGVLEQRSEGTEVIITFPASIHPHAALPRRGGGSPASGGAEGDQGLGSGEGSAQSLEAEDSWRIQLDELGRMGFSRFYEGGEIKSLASWTGENHIHVVADRIFFKRSDRKRIVDSLEQAFRFGGGRIDLWIQPDQHLAFTNRLDCPTCNITYRTPFPNLFSFNSPVGACEICRGFGKTIEVDLNRIIPDPSLSLEQGAIKPFGGIKEGRFEFKDLKAFCRSRKISMDVPFKDLAESQQEALIEGSREYYGIKGFFKWLEGRTYKMHVRVYLSRYRSTVTCPDCHGTRFKSETLLYRVGGITIGELYSMSIGRAAAFFNSLHVSAEDKASLLILEEIRSRLRYLQEVGLGYLTLDRQSRTLSGGEVQRVALTSALGSSLVNTLYVLDEPSIGLHPRDNHRLIRILKGLRDLENTVVVVEHDPEIISQSDFMLDLGPGAGEAGGKVMYFGPTAGVNGSLTGQYLRGKKFIPVPEKRRKPKANRWLTVKGASENNLKNLEVKIPLGLFVCLTGVSGSGKSTLAEEILYKGMKRMMGNPQGEPGRHSSISGGEAIDDVLLVDQKPIGRSPRANPLTYLKAMDPIRKLLAGTEAAREKGMGARYFSFNVADGRCPTCQGAGFEKVEMQFLSDVFITCPDCGGKRFKKQVLEIRYKDKSVDDILSMTVNQAIAFFGEHSIIGDALQPLVDVGLGYMRLGQPVNTLSGGEAQRLKLCSYLKTTDLKPRLFIFDEPTTGLHFEDIRKLLSVLQRLVDQGHTVLVIEHNMDVVKTADWVIDLGPEGGEAGGSLLVAGPPERVAEDKRSHTAGFLKNYLPRAGRVKSFAPAKTPSSFPQVPAVLVRGAREHNLKDLTVSIPRQKLVVVTGISGSGKSTLLFDILFAEGQRRYLESLAPYVRQYVKILERPDVDSVSGLSPTVAIQQRISHAGARSTVATLTEIYHFLRLLYSKLGSQHCPGCGRELSAQNLESIIAQIGDRYRREKAVLLAPKVTGRKGFHKEVLARALRKGFKQARIDGRIMKLEENMSLSRYYEHTIDLVVTRLPAKNVDGLVRVALEEGAGNVMVLKEGGAEEIFSQKGICPVCGIGLQSLDPRLFSFNSKLGACRRCEGLGAIGESGKKVCPKCGGSRLKPEALSVKIQGYSIWDLVQQPASQLYETLKRFSFSPRQAPIAGPVMAEILMRLAFVNRLGLSYLSLDRSGDTLSGGEGQRIRLAAQLGSNLTGVSYILDEPTIGLHARDNRILLDALKELKERGNSIFVVEHDEETIREADHIIDLGPGAGREGGQVVASGNLADLKKNPASITGISFDGKPHELTSRLRSYRERPTLRVISATEHNLKGIDAALPLGTLICVTGVSGSGKSTLLKETLYKGLQNLLLQRHDPAGACVRMDGWEALDRVLEVDHSPIGYTPRSVPSSYVGFLPEIRHLLSMTPEARARGYRPSRFSFNLAGGRCEACKGHGAVKVEMSFLPDVYVNCEVCHGKRFNQETLDITYRGKNIAEILNLTFEEAKDFFIAIPPIRHAVEVVCRIGLGYLRIGQPSPTLSGGEAQRIKLAEELAKTSRGRTLYILDEPTTGLHISDVKKLVDVLQALVDQGNTVAMIEHNMEMIKEADYIIDLGPEGGEAGGRVVTTGSPAELLVGPNGSHTTRYLKKYLER
jgi:excinuclease ABC subunit A